MTGWSDGYVTDIDYTREAYREMTPIWLTMAALMMGQLPPDIDKPFRYADLGCGQGLGATFIAATYPHAEVWGFDFNPAHIDSARRLATAAGLANLHFEEASFAELAAAPDAALPGFEFVAAHGVMSWISPDNRDALVRFIGRRLAPGGLAYVGYNTETGWASMRPVRSLMRLLAGASADRSDQAVSGVLEYLEILRDANAGYFAANPAAAGRVKDLAKEPARYVAHEYLNASWHPLAFAEVAALMEGAKCGFIGSASLTENANVLSAPPAMLPLLNEATSVTLRETLRDFGIAQAFRRDIFRRGIVSLPALAAVRRLEEMAITYTGVPVEDPIKLMTPMGQVSGLPEIYRPLMAALSAGDTTIGALRQSGAFAQRSSDDLLQAVALLVMSGYAHPVLPQSVRARAGGGADRLNVAIADLNADGGEITRLASAALGSDIRADPLDIFVVREKLAGRSMEIEALTDRILAVLSRSGRTMQQAGKPVSDMAMARAVAREAVQRALAERLPPFKRLGVV